MSTLRVAIVSPERKIWSGEAEMVVAKGIDGDVGIMAGHAPMLIQLEIFSLRVIERLSPRSEEVVIVDGGFLNVTPGEDETRVDVLAEHAELAREIDATAARARAEELRRRVEQDGEVEVETELAKALVRAEHGTR